MADGLWRPASEHDATRNETAFIEWLRATGHMPEATPDAWRAWATANESRFLDAVLEFAGLQDDRSPPDRTTWRRAVAADLLVLDHRPDDPAP